MSYFARLAARIVAKGVEEVVRGGTQGHELFPGFGMPQAPGLPDVETITPEKQIALYRSWAYTCANRNASAIASVPLRLYAGRGKGMQKARCPARPVNPVLAKRLRALPSCKASPAVTGAVDFEEIEDHPLLALLRDVNPHMDGMEFVELLSLYLDISGNCYWHVVRGEGVMGGLPMELWILPANLVTIIPSKTDFVAGYLYGRNPSRRVRFEAEQVLHFRRPSLRDLWYGMSRIEGAFFAVTGHESMERYERNLAETRGLKDFIVSYKGGTLSADRRRELMREWARALRVASTERLPLIADNDFDVKEATFSPKELTFLAGRKWRQEEIISAFGQNPALYDPSANVANIRGAIFMWERYEITPTLRRIEQKLNASLVPMYGEPRLFLAFDDIVEGDPTEARADYQLLLSNGYPINRVLEDMKRDPIPNGDVGLISAGMVPLGTDTAARLTQPLIPFGREEGEDETPPIREGASKSVVWSSTFKVAGKPGTGHVGKLSPVQRQIIAALDRAWERQLGEALKRLAADEAEDFRWVASDEWAQEIYKLTHRLLEHEIVVGAERGQRAVGVAITDFIDRPTVVRAVRQHAYRFARAVNATTADRLRKVTEEGVRAGDSIPALSERIRTVYSGWTEERSEMIARTESARALVTGEELQWKESGVVEGKIWLASSDACPFCLKLNGSQLPLNATFLSLGDTLVVPFGGKILTMQVDYEPIYGPPLHPFCRCDLLPAVIDLASRKESAR